MESINDIEAQLITAVCDAPAPVQESIFNRNVPLNYFQAHQDEWNYLQEYYKEFGAFPTRAVITTEFPDFFPEHPSAGVDYYIKYLTDRYNYSIVSDGLGKVTKLLSSPGFDSVDAAINVLKSMEGRFEVTKTSKDIDVAKNARLGLEEYDAEETGSLFPSPYDGLVDGKIAPYFTSGELIIMFSRMGMGKALPMNSMVLMEDGKWKKNKDLVVGDRLASVDGKPSRVTGVYPQGVRKMFKLTFRDGREATASDDHLWEVHCAKWKTPKILTSKNIFRLMKDKHRRGTLWIQLISGDFGKTQDLPKDPYVLGKYLTKGDIPEAYFESPREVRMRLLQGIMDSRGSVVHATTPRVYTYCFEMAYQLQRLIRSLGGVSYITQRLRKNRRYYTVSVSLRDRKSLFTRPDKQAKLEPNKYSAERLTIKDIQVEEPEDCQCISVSHPTRLYITEDYVVTHNTWVALWMAISDWWNGHDVLFFTPEMTARQLVARRDALLFGLNYTKMQFKSFSPEEYQEYEKAISHLESLDTARFIICGLEDFSSTREKSWEYLRRKTIEHGCKSVYVDSAHLLFGVNGLNFVEEAYMLSRQGKQLAKSLDVKLLFTVQAGREAEGKKSVGGGLKAIQWGDSFAQDGDFVCELKGKRGSSTRELDWIKTRRGQEGSILINYQFEPMNLTEIEGFMGEDEAEFDPEGDDDDEE